MANSHPAHRAGAVPFVEEFEDVSELLLEVSKHGSRDRAATAWLVWTSCPCSLRFDETRHEIDDASGRHVRLGRLPRFRLGLRRVGGVGVAFQGKLAA